MKKCAYLFIFSVIFATSCKEKDEKMTEEMVNEISKKKLYDYMMKAGSNSDPKKDTKDRGMNVVKATGKYLNKEETELVNTVPVTANEPTVRVGIQKPLGKNLNVDHFANGDLIPQAKTKERGPPGSPQKKT